MFRYFYDYEYEVFVFFGNGVVVEGDKEYLIKGGDVIFVEFNDVY